MDGIIFHQKESINFLFPVPGEAVSETEPKKAIEFLKIGERCQVKPEKESFFCLIPEAKDPAWNRFIPVVPDAKVIAFSFLDTHEHHIDTCPNLNSYAFMHLENGIDH